jgi:hypothetical protein
MADSFSPEQLAQLKKVFREALEDVGLRTDGPDHIEEARRDFMFVRSFRRGITGTASKIGWSVIVAVLGLVFWLVTQGLNFWKGS